MWKNNNTNYCLSSYRHSRQLCNNGTLNRFSGFTLIELLLGIAIIGMLVAFALPAYFNQVASARNSDGFNTLTVTASRMQSKFLDERHYDFVDPDTNTRTAGECAIDISVFDNNHYEYTCETKEDGSKFELTASSKDSKYEYTLDENGDRATVKFDGSTDGVSAGCWQITKAGECI